MRKIGSCRLWQALWGALVLCSGVRAQADSVATAAQGEVQADVLFDQNTLQGPTGGFRILDAGSGPRGSFRLALYTEFFFIRDFLVSDDKERYQASSLSLSLTPLAFLEVFASAQVSSSWNNAGDPELIQVVADTLLGVKGFHWIRPWLALGGDASVLFPGGVGDPRRTFSATSVGLRGNATLDFRSFGERSIPLIARFNTQYWFDNTAELVEDIENDRLETEGQTRPLGQTNLLNPIERFGYNVSRVDTVRLGVGAEAPLRAGKLGIHPLLEWRWHIPVNRQGFQCVFSSSASTPEAGAESCLAIEKARAFPMMLTAGVRLFPPLRGLAVNVAVDVGLTGSRRPFVRELAPVAPYQIVIGVAYAVDQTKRAPSPPASSRTKTRTADEPVEAMNAGSVPGDDPARILLTTVDEMGRPLPIVPITVQGPSGHRVMTDSEGRAALEGIPSGSYTVFVDEEGYLMSVREIEVGPGEEAARTVRIFPQPTRPRVVVRKRRLALSERVGFATGSAKILPRSEPVLAEVAHTLFRNPDIELVEIQGHSDNRGSRALNLELSQKRAEAVRAWLVDHGVGADRLVARGYGSSRPLAPNITAYNRAQNRRVQFIIERRTSEPAGDASN